MTHQTSTQGSPDPQGNYVSFVGIKQTFSSKRSTVVALDDIQVGIDEGEFVSIVGPSGCGKSTLMRIAAGLVRPTSGSVTIEGQVVSSPHPGVGVVFQRATLLPWRDVIGNINMQLEMRGLSLQSYEARVRELISLTGLTGFEGAMPHELSGGMQQRASLCRALIHDPDILLMDEPFGALDAMTRETMNLELQRIWMQKRKTVIFITHSISESVLLSDRVIVMSARPGRVIKEVKIDLPRPRDFQMVGHPAFLNATNEIRIALEAVGMTE
jgi:NitT/TauT family transport system ATP-binding protein